MWIGDLCVLRGDAATGGAIGLDAVAIADGRGNLFGWHGDDMTRMSTVVYAVGHVSAAWRVGG